LAWVALGGLHPATPAAAEAPAALVAASLAAWSDGRAELDGYRLVQPRYGELRSGSVALIFVKEPFSDSSRVKADPGVHPPSDVFEAMKLNVVKEFQTGIYDYHLMTSAFLAFEPRRGRRAGAPAKLVFSSQEWCGALFEELLFDEQAVRQSRSSYFDGEGDERRTLDLPGEAIAVDELPVLVRGIPLLLLELGESRAVSFLPALERTRLQHKKLAWTPGRLSRGKEPSLITVPAGRYLVETWTAELEGGDRYSYQVERESPHHLVAWSGPDGERAELRGTARLKYWELHGEGDEKFLAPLGLARLPRLE
jgi:hypothetical protein